jgi:hypothetical protein
MSEGGQLLIWGLRHRMVAMLQGRPVPLSVARSVDGAGGSDTYAALTAFILLAARDADRPLAINPPCCPELSADEENIARALAALTRKSTSAALGALRALTGREPSAGLHRAASAIAERFSSVGLNLGLGDTAERDAPA